MHIEGNSFDQEQLTNHSRTLEHTRIIRFLRNSEQDDINYTYFYENINLKNQILPRIQKEDVINQDELKNLLDELKCPICLNIIEDPRTCIKCEYNFCYSCIKEWDNQERAKKCPCCRDQGQESYLFQRDRERNEHRPFHLSIQSFNAKYTNCPRIFKKILNTIQIICHNVGCNGVVKFDERQIHLKSCLYQSFNCPNKDCTEQVTKLSESEHKKVCEHRMEECKYCNGKYNVMSMVIHEDFCEENKKKCLDCGQDIQVYMMHEHQKNCQHKEIQCEICENIFYHKDFKYHTEAFCYEIFKSSLETIKKKDKEVLNKDKQLLEKEKQMNKISSMIQNLNSLNSPQVDRSIDQQQIEEIIQISNKVSDQKLLEQQRSQMIQNNSIDLERSEYSVQLFENTMDEEIQSFLCKQVDENLELTINFTNEIDKSTSTKSFKEEGEFGDAQIKKNDINLSEYFKEEEEKEEIVTNKIDNSFKYIRCKQVDVKQEFSDILTNEIDQSLKTEFFKQEEDLDSNLKGFERHVPKYFKEQEEFLQLIQDRKNILI